jgi:hypothetical protein
MWVIAGLVARGWIWEHEGSEETAGDETLFRETIFEPQGAPA